MKNKINLSKETLEIILKKINRQKLSNLSRKAIFDELKTYKLTTADIDYIFNNFDELKKKYIKSFPKRLTQKETYKTKVERKISQLVKKGYSQEYARSNAEKEFKTDKSVKISFVEGGKTNKR